MKGDILNESHLKEKIGQDLWKQLRRVSIPVFNGDKRQYDNWKSAFIACVDKAPATPEYKLLQLRQYLSGEALKSIETTKMRICGINGCKDSHNRLLHRDKLVRSETSTPTEESKRNSNKTQNFIEGKRFEKTMHAAKLRHQNEELVLRTVPVVLKKGNRKMVVNALLDDGSTKTYINEDVARELKLEGQRQRVSVSVLSGQCKEFENMPVEVQLESLDGRINTKIEALTANRVTGDMRSDNELTGENTQANGNTSPTLHFLALARDQ